MLAWNIMNTIQASGSEITVFVWESTTDVQYSLKMTVKKDLNCKLKLHSYWKKFGALLAQDPLLYDCLGQFPTPFQSWPSKSVWFPLGNAVEIHSQKYLFLGTNILGDMDRSLWEIIFVIILIIKKGKQ